MTLGTMLILGVVEQIIMFAVVLPTTGFWFSFFGLSAIWTLVTQGTGSNEKE